MSKSLPKKILHEADEALEDALHELKKASARLGDEAEDALSHAAARLSHAAHALAVEAREGARAATRGAAAGVQRHPLAAAAVAASAAALIGLAVARRLQSED